MSISNKSQYIFKLIKSMSPSEKRYFTLFVSAFEKTNKTYIKLFTAIDKQKEYDEKALKIKFKNESFANHFAVVKNNLFKMILKSLRVYHTDSHPVKIVNQYKDNYILLLNKGLFDLASAQLTKAMKVAEENNLITETLLLKSWRNNSMMLDFFLNNVDFDIEAPLKEPLEQVKVIENFHKSVYIRRQIEIFHHKGLVRTKASIQKLIDWTNDPFLVEDQKSPSVTSQVIKIEARITCHVSLKEYSKAQLLSKRLLDLSMNNVSEILMVGNFFNYIYISLWVDDWKTIDSKAQECLSHLDALNKNKITIMDNDRYYYNWQYHSKLTHCLLHRKFKNIQNILPKIIENYLIIEKDLSLLYQWNYSYEFAYAYFIIDEFEESQKYIVKLLNTPIPKNRKDYYIGTQILNLFNHYELGNFEHLSYQIKNTKELIKRQDYYFGFEKTCIEFLSKLCKVTKDKKSDLLISYQEKFTELHKKTWELDAFEKFDVLGWIKQKQLTKTIKRKLNHSIKLGTTSKEAKI